MGRSIAFQPLFFQAPSQLSDRGSRNVMKLILSYLGRNFGLLLVFALMGSIGFAQPGRGTLRGVVNDEFGAVVVGATVTLTDAAGTAKTAVTNNDGVYTFSGLAPGKYTVSGTATGFAIRSEERRVGN